MISILLILSGIGIAVYFTGFWVEPSGPRWNLSTFLNSFQSAFLIGIIPFLFFTIINYRFFGMQTLSFSSRFGKDYRFGFAQRSEDGKIIVSTSLNDPLSKLILSEVEIDIERSRNTPNFVFPFSKEQSYLNDKQTE